MRVFLVWILMTFPVLAAIGPEEVMEDAGLQSRAMALYEELRCVRCQSENIASSNADWASDARAVVRERLLAGDSNAEVKAFFQARYGDYVLMNPPLSADNLMLWLMGPILLLIGATVAFLFLRSRAPKPEAAATVLNAEEQARLAALTGKDG